MLGLIDSLKDFATTKILRKILNKKEPHHYKLDAIVEFDDGEHAIVRTQIADAIPYPKIMKVKRITFFIEARDKSKPRPSTPCEEVEIEFVACSRD